MTEAFNRPTCSRCGHRSRTYAELRVHVADEHSGRVDDANQLRAPRPIGPRSTAVVDGPDVRCDGLVSTRVLCQLAGITFRQADYWTRCGYLTPAIEAIGSGSRRLFDENGVMLAAVLGTVPPVFARDRAGSYQFIREALANEGYDAASLRLAFDDGHPAAWLYIDLDVIRAEIAERRAAQRVVA